MDFIFYKLKKAQKTWILFFRKLFHTKPRQGTVRRDQLFIVLIVDTHGSFDFESVLMNVWGSIISSRNIPIKWRKLKNSV